MLLVASRKWKDGRANDFNRSSEKPVLLLSAKPGSRQKANRFPEMGNFFIIPISARDLFLYRYKFVHDPAASNLTIREWKKPRLKNLHALRSSSNKLPTQCSIFINNLEIEYENCVIRFLKRNIIVKFFLINRENCLNLTR